MCHWQWRIVDGYDAVVVVFVAVAVDLAFLGMDDCSRLHSYDAERLVIRVSRGLVFCSTVRNEISLDRWSRCVVFEVNPRELCRDRGVQNDVVVFQDAFRAFVDCVIPFE